MTVESSAGVNEEFRIRVQQQEAVAKLSKQALETDDIDVVIQDTVATVTNILNSDYYEVLELLLGETEIFSDMVSVGRSDT